MNLANLREDYTKGGISRSSIKSDPFTQFEDWLEVAHEQKIPDAKREIDEAFYQIQNKGGWDLNSVRDE